MQWWNDFVTWFNSDEGWQIVSTAIIPFVAIVVAGLVAALIGRASTRRVISLTDRERRIATVTALISAARRASKWNTLSVPEQQHAEHLVHEADTRIRLLPIPGTALAADWAAHEIAQMKKNSVNFSFQADQSLIEFRDRLVEWQAKPSRAKKLFKGDLDTWAYESTLVDQDLVTKQQEWARRQVNETGPIAVSPASPSTTPAVAPPAVSPAVTPAASSGSAAQAGFERPAAVATAESSTPAAEPRKPFSWGASRTSAASPVATPPASTPEPAAPATHSVDVPSNPDDTSFTAPGPVSAETVRKRINPDDAY
ncbi:hypothetical protein FB562_0769 [Homoserinimonas aerilata]|uniref:Uncharacterized protein n=1 Tax=Homoserinimonas aerilata TaxID=1162970 RepID=A0A542YI68_9MICO|nr:hypothetical protein [Homoserinimonas aerilata]TQL47701.1 hypothetical protein FB562_0769 [Homoserinimonas aerilata]